jgi:hypothetical protein
MREFCLCPGTNKRVDIFFSVRKHLYSKNNYKLMFKLNNNIDAEKQNHHRKP